jgi:hypothetical protein
LTKERLFTLLRNTLGFMDLKLMSEEEESGGCTWDRILEEIEMTEEEYDLILSGDWEQPQAGTWMPGGGEVD